MSLTYSSRIIADIRVLGVFGVKGIGFYQLRFSLEFSMPSWDGPENMVVLSGMRGEIAAGAISGSLKLLGCAAPETPVSIETKSFSQKCSMQYILNISEQQLYSLETLRNGGGLYFRMTVSGEAIGSKDRQHAREELSLEVNLSDWSRVLQELEYSKLLVVGIELPKAELGHRLRPAIELVSRAHNDLLGGRYDSVVSLCRQALESVRVVLGQKEEIAGALDKFCKGQRKVMSKHERELVIGEAVRHYTHLAHHVGDAGEQQWYSRGDANFILAISASAISSEIANSAVGGLQLH